MRTWHAHISVTRLQVGIALAVVVLLSLLVLVLLRQEDTSWPSSAFERAVQKLQLVQAISRDLLAALRDLAGGIADGLERRVRHRQADLGRLHLGQGEARPAD